MEKEKLKTLKCRICNKEIVKSPKLSNKQWEKKEYCSVRCRQKGRSIDMNGKQLRENNPNWNKDSNDMDTLHLRVKSIRGTPSKCESCGDENAKVYDWANMTGDYKDANDFKRLCRPCHVNYDRKELITLKDLPLSEIDKKILRLKAVKWVKKMREIYKIGDTLFKEHGKLAEGFELDLYDYEQDDVAGAVKFAMFFFNLTEEDLKQWN